VHCHSSELGAWEVATLYLQIKNKTAQAILHMHMHMHMHCTALQATQQGRVCGLCCASIASDARLSVVGCGSA